MEHTALITGASGGIGRELARLCAGKGWKLVLVSRNEEKMQALAAELDTEVLVVPLDLSTRDASETLKKKLDALNIKVDVLINNAGFGSKGAFSNLDLANELSMIDLNVRAVTHLTGVFLPEMLERGRGKILNVASIAGFQPGPYMATYFATKAYVLSFSEALWAETKGTGVTVTCLCPGPTSTDFGARAESDVLFKGKLMTSHVVALIGMNAMLKGKRTVICGLKNKMMVLGSRFVPKQWALRAVVKMIGE